MHDQLAGSKPAGKAQVLQVSACGISGLAGPDSRCLLFVGQRYMRLAVGSKVAAADSGLELTRSHEVGLGCL